MILGAILVLSATFLAGVTVGAYLAAKIVGAGFGKMLRDSVSKGEVDPNSVRVLLDRLAQR